MDTGRERPLFEQWAQKLGYELDKFKDGGYQSAETEDAWFVWCARAKLER